MFAGSQRYRKFIDYGISKLKNTREAVTSAASRALGAKARILSRLLTRC
jgi:hypothetical protein